MPLFSVRRNVVQRLLVCLALLAAARSTAGDSWRDYTNNRTVYDDQIRDIQARRAEMDRGSSNSFSSSGYTRDRSGEMYMLQQQREAREYWEAGERRMREKAERERSAAARAEAEEEARRRRGGKQCWACTRRRTRAMPTR